MRRRAAREQAAAQVDPERPTSDEVTVTVTYDGRSARRLLTQASVGSAIVAVAAVVGVVSVTAGTRGSAGHSESPRAAASPPPSRSASVLKFETVEARNRIRDADADDR